MVQSNSTIHTAEAVELEAEREHIVKCNSSLVEHETDGKTINSSIYNLKSVSYQYSRSNHTHDDNSIFILDLSIR